MARPGPTPTPPPGSGCSTRVHRELHPDPNPEPRWITRACNSRTLRRLRRLNPIWWLRRAMVRGVDLVHESATKSEQAGTVTAVLAGDPVGRLSYQVCATCRIGLIYKVAVDDVYRGLGLGDRLLRVALTDAAAANGYTWTTTAQDTGAVGFWRTTGRRHRVGFTETPGNGAPCPHIDL